MIARILALAITALLLAGCASSEKSGACMIFPPSCLL